MTSYVYVYLFVFFFLSFFLSSFSSSRGCETACRHAQDVTVGDTKTWSSKYLSCREKFRERKKNAANIYFFFFLYYFVTSFLLRCCVIGWWCTLSSTRREQAISQPCRNDRITRSRKNVRRLFLDSTTAAWIKVTFQAPLQNYPRPKWTSPWLVTFKKRPRVKKEFDIWRQICDCGRNPPKWELVQSVN